MKNNLLILLFNDKVCILYLREAMQQTADSNKRGRE